ncbi:181_t:CDS:2, partial [Gigaspora margarita]
SRQYARSSNLKISKFENNDYEIVSLPYGPDFDADDIRDLTYKKGMKLNFTRDLLLGYPYLPMLFWTMHQIFRDFCGSCPQAQTPDKIKQQENSRCYVSGELKFIKQHFDLMDTCIAKNQDEWISDAYIMEPRENLFVVAARKIIQKNAKELDLNARDHFGKTLLQLAVLGGHFVAVQELIKYGIEEIIKEFLVGTNVETNVETDTNSDESIDTSWNHSFSPLEYAILFGHINAINCLIEVGANVCRRKTVKNISTTSFNTKVLKIYYPLSLCLLTR